MNYHLNLLTNLRKYALENCINYKITCIPIHHDFST